MRRKTKRFTRVHYGVIVAVGTVVLILFAVLIAKLFSPAAEDDAVPASAPTQLAASPSSPSATPFPAAPTSSPTEASTQQPAATPPQQQSARAALRPSAAPGGYLPVFAHAKTQEKIIAVTVDDCFQFSNLDKILDYTVTAGGKITIFPIGQNVMKAGLQPILRRAYDLGMEFENHSFSHSAFYRLSAEDMAGEIFNQQRAVSYVLGVDYKMHFMRTRGGDNRNDLRTHQYITKLGYYGMVHWNISGSGTDIKKLCSTIAPGNIYLFHTTDSDTKKLSVFLEYAASQGYQLVTLNEMFGYPENEALPLETPAENWEVPAPDEYVYDYKTLKKNDYLWDVYLLQERLQKLGWLSGDPDGVYGKGTYNAVGYFQLAAGLEATGTADPHTQQVLFSDDAPVPGGKTVAPKVAQTSAPDTNAVITPVPTTPPRAAASDHREIDFSLFD